MKIFMSYYLLLLLIDYEILSDFVARNNQESNQRSNYGKLKKFNSRERETIES